MPRVVVGVVVPAANAMHADWTIASPAIVDKTRFNRWPFSGLLSEYPFPKAIRGLDFSTVTPDIGTGTTHNLTSSPRSQ